MFMLLPIAALLLASCSQDEQQFTNPQRPDVPEGAIYFTSGIQGMTRGLTTMENFTSFNVAGMHNNDVSDEFSFSAITVSTADAGATWSYDGGFKYYPGDNSNISFYAYAPTSLSASASITNDTKQIADFTQGTTVADQTDVLASYATGNKINNSLSGVTIDFKHALAQIEVKAKNSSTDKYKVFVLGAKLCRAKKTGTMTFQEAVAAYPTWGSLSTPQDFITKLATSVELTGDAEFICKDNFLMLPQELTAWNGLGGDDNNAGAYIAVLCQIKSLKDGTSDWVWRFPDTASEGKYGFTAIPISTKWQPGHKYVYTLDFFGEGGGAGLVDPLPTNPENADDTDVDPNPQPLDEDGTAALPESGPGTAIIPEAKANIKFSVTITDWTTAEGDRETLNL